MHSCCLSFRPRAGPARVCVLCSVFCPEPAAPSRLRCAAGILIVLLYAALQVKQKLKVLGSMKTKGAIDEKSREK